MASKIERLVRSEAKGAAARKPQDHANDLSNYVVDALPPAPENGLAPSMAKARWRMLLVLLLADVAMICASYFLVGFAYLVGYLGQYSLEGTTLPATLLLPIFLTIGLFNGTYASDALTDGWLATKRAVAALAIAATLLSFVTFFARMNADLSRFVFLVGALVALASMAAFRFALAHRLRNRWGKNPMNRLIIDAGGPAIALEGAFKLDADACGLLPELENPAALNRLAQYLRNMDEVVISCTDQTRADWSRALRGAGIHGEVVSPFAHKVGAIGIRHYHTADFSTLVIATGPLRLRDRAIKRSFDIAVSLLGLAILGLPMLLVALAIRLEDGAPAIFRQRRMGRSNQFFEILKFRSMRHALQDKNGSVSTEREDARITNIGRIIRSTSIDELPQLINVLRGEMSIVGPRPHALGSHAGDKLFWQVDGRYWLRHSLRPGITGLAQIRGFRGATDLESDLEDRLQADLEYLRNWSLWRDVRIILSTLRVVMHDKAY